LQKKSPRTLKNVNGEISPNLVTVLLELLVFVLFHPEADPPNNSPFPKLGRFGLKKYFSVSCEAT
jgi:hypothetical protein